MPSIWVVSPAWGRFAVTRLVLAQRRRLCDELARRGLDAQMLIVADDENLEIAREHGALTLEHPNVPLGAKWNAALRYACDQGADWVVWIGSDDWIHVDVFDPLPFQDGPRPPMLIGHRLAVVDLRAGVMRRCSSPSRYGAVPWIIPRHMLERARFQPVRPNSRRGLDGALIRGLRLARAHLHWHYHNPHDLRCVDFKSGTNITRYEQLTKNLSIAGDEDPWLALAERYPADLVDLARRTHEQGVA